MIWTRRVTLITSAALLACAFAPAEPFFADVTATAGISGASQAAWADYNADGFVDVIIGGTLFRNEGDKTFTDVTATAGLPGGGGGWVWGDYDNDGLPDLFCYSGKGSLYHNNTDGTFSEIDFPELPTIISRGAVFVDLDGDGLVDLYVGGYEQWSKEEFYQDAVYRNAGGGTFTEHWVQPDGEKWATRGITTADFDEDGDTDIYCSNYRLQPNTLWRNDGGMTLTDVAADYGVAGTPQDIVSYFQGRQYPSHGHTIGSAFADLDNDGHLDLFVGNFSHPPAYQDRPYFLRNQGAPSFHFGDMSARAGLRWQESYASPAFADYDNDGNLDLYFTTVYQGDHSLLYRNAGDWQFTDVTAAAGIEADRTYQAAWADYDNDGDLDLLTAGKLYENRHASGHWLRVKLVADGPTTGAQARIEIGSSTLTRQIEGATGEGNQNEPTLHFGLGEHAAEVSVAVVWPGGQKQSVRTPADRLVSIEQPPQVAGSERDYLLHRRPRQYWEPWRRRTVYQ